jgi:hypothetical protein
VRAVGRTNPLSRDPSNIAPQIAGLSLASTSKESRHN